MLAPGVLEEEALAAGALADPPVPEAELDVAEVLLLDWEDMSSAVASVRVAVGGLSRVAGAEVG